jgi:hypothetical protein
MALDRQSEFVSIDTQPNDDVMPLDLEKQIVLRAKRLRRVRNVRCFRSIRWVLRLPGS